MHLWQFFIFLFQVWCSGLQQLGSWYIYFFKVWGWRGKLEQWCEYIIGDSFCFSPINNWNYELLQYAMYCFGISPVSLMVGTWNSDLGIIPVCCVHVFECPGTWGCYSQLESLPSSLGNVLYSSGPQPFWYQGQVLWKTVFPRMGAGGWFRW